jgi:hypothetical protein
MHPEIFIDLFTLITLYIFLRYLTILVFWGGGGGGIQRPWKIKNGDNKKLDMAPTHFKVLPCYLPGETKLNHESET